MEAPADGRLETNGEKDACEGAEEGPGGVGGVGRVGARVGVDVGEVAAAGVVRVVRIDDGRRGAVRTRSVGSR